MANHDIFDSIRENLNGRPGQPMLFGVCQALAARSGLEPWLIRAAAIVLGVFFTGPVLLAYVLAGVFLPETAERTKGIFQGLFVLLREGVDKALDVINDLFKPGSGSAGRS